MINTKHRGTCNRWVKTKNKGRVRCGKTKLNIKGGGCTDHMPGTRQS